MNHRKLIQDRIKIFYRIISGSARANRDWDQFKALFVPEANLTTILKSKEKIEHKTWNVDSYIKRLDLFLAGNNIYETSTNYKISSTENIAQVTSNYEAKRNKEDKKAIKTGIAHMHLVRQEEQWRIISMLWEDDDKNAP